MKISAEAKRQLFEMTKLCYQQQLFAGTSGNLSIYDKDAGIMVITPTSIPYETIKVEDLVSIRLDGERIDGRYEPSSEWRVHAAIYQNFPEVESVIHTHSPYATAFAVNNRAIPVVLIEMIPFLGGDVPVAAFAIPGTDEVGENAVAVLKDRNACLLANHGVVAIGASLEQAHIRAVYVEDAAKICSIAMNNGEIVTIPDETVTFMKNRK